VDQLSENNGVTKQDLLDMETRLTERIAERVGGRIDAFEERLKSYIAAAHHDLKTRIVAEFYK
jgi:hypothetical protein